MTNYEAVVKEILADLEQELKDYKSGEMMSMAEAVHGEIHSRSNIRRLNALIEKHTSEDL